MLDNDINILVYNFVDMLSHARTERVDKGPRK